MAKIINVRVDEGTKELGVDELLSIHSLACGFANTTKYSEFAHKELSDFYHKYNCWRGNNWSSNESLWTLASSVSKWTNKLLLAQLNK